MNESLQNKIDKLREIPLNRELLDRLKKLWDPKDRKKLGAIELSYEKSSEEVCDSIKCTPRQLSGWIDKFTEEGLKKFGKISIKKDEEFENQYTILSTGGNDFQFLDIAKKIKKSVEEKYGNLVTPDSLKNCVGTWHELAFLMAAHNSILRSSENLYLVKMGSETSIKFWEIYQKESRQKYDLLVDIFKKKEDPIFIRCSTPDFVVITQDVIRDSSRSHILQNPSPTLHEINELYKIIKNKCLPHQVKGFISLKTSNRPDRRYQILVEANVTKFASKYIHPPDHPLRFDVIGESNASDIEVFKAPLMSTLPLTLDGDVDIVERAIDDETNITSSSQLDSYWERYK